MKIMMTVLAAFLALQANASVGSGKKTVWSCKETNNGGAVLDGAKVASVTADQFGFHHLTVVQKDQFSGDKTFIKDLLVNEEKCSGFIPCVIYTPAPTRADRQGSLRFFINIFQGKLGEGSLVIKGSKGTLSAQFLCKKI